MNIAVAGPRVAPGVNAETPRATTIAIVAMGGEGGGVLADWIVDLAEHASYLAQTASVPGVAQRTGFTVYYIEIFPKGLAVAANKAPILALMPVPGELDIVLASELMEAGRAIQRGMVTPDRTILIASTHRIYSMTEKTALGDGQVDAKSLIEGGQAAARDFVHNDFAGIQRLADYQDVDYAAWYLDKLKPILGRETAYGNGSVALLSETARYLALWMSYEDVTRVADLKTRDTRFARVHQESRANANQLVQIKEFLHPGVEEISDMLPASLGRWLLNSGWTRRWIERFTRKGRVVHSTSLWGFLQLYGVAALRPWRRRSLRFAEEQKRICAWLEQIPVLAQENYALAV